MDGPVFLARGLLRGDGGRGESTIRLASSKDQPSPARDQAAPKVGGRGEETTATLLPNEQLQKNPELSSRVETSTRQQNYPGPLRGVVYCDGRGWGEERRDRNHPMGPVQRSSGREGLRRFFSSRRFARPSFRFLQFWPGSALNAARPS